MTISIPETVLDGLLKWMQRGRWCEHLNDVFDEHTYAYCDLYDLDTIEELSAKIGQHWFTHLSNIVLMDFLARITEDGNVVDLYLKRRGWKEKSIPKAFFKGVRDSVMSLYEVSDIRHGESFLARDLILGGDPILVEESTATKNMLQWEQIAMRIVEVRGHNIVVGGMLPYKSEVAEQVIGEFSQFVVDVRTDFEGMFKGQIGKMFKSQSQDPAPELIQQLTLVMSLAMSAPLISEVWLMETEFDTVDSLGGPKQHIMDFERTKILLSEDLNTGDT